MWTPRPQRLVKAFTYWLWSSSRAVCKSAPTGALEPRGPGTGSHLKDLALPYVSKLSLLSVGRGLSRGLGTEQAVDTFHHSDLSVPVHVLAAFAPQNLRGLLPQSMSFRSVLSLFFFSFL